MFSFKPLRILCGRLARPKFASACENFALACCGDRVPRLSARLWKNRYILKCGIMPQHNVGVTVRFIANVGCANRMQRHVASLAKNVPPARFLNARLQVPSDLYANQIIRGTLWSTPWLFGFSLHIWYNFWLCRWLLVKNPYCFFTWEATLLMVQLQARLFKILDSLP